MSRGSAGQEIMFSSSTLSLAAPHRPFNISGPLTAFTDTKLQEQTKVGREGGRREGGGQHWLANWLRCMKRFHLNEIIWCGKSNKNPGGLICPGHEPTIQVFKNLSVIFRPRMIYSTPLRSLRVIQTVKPRPPDKIFPPLESWSEHWRLSRSSPVLWAVKYCSPWQIFDGQADREFTLTSK